MERRKTPSQIFLVLVPHRDVRLALRNFIPAALLEECGQVFNFPRVAPLAALSSPLNMEELKLCARAVRAASLIPFNGKIICTEAAAAAFPAFDGAAIYGPRLDLAISQNAFSEAAGGGAKKIAALFSPSVIGCCLLNANCRATAKNENFPQVSFRAAAVANMFWRPSRALNGYKWKIDPLCWLPRQRA